MVILTRIALLSLLLITNSCRHYFDIDALDRTLPYDQGSENVVIDDYLLILYFGDKDCHSCYHRSLLRLGELDSAGFQELSTLIVTHPGNQRAAIEQTLQGLRRTGTLASPILLEENQGELGLGDTIRFLLIDTRTNEIVYSHQPRYGVDTWTEHLANITRIIEDSSR